MARDEPFVTPSPLVVVVKGCGGPSAPGGPPPLFQGSRWNLSVILRAVPFDIFPSKVFALEGLEVARWRKAAGFAIVPEGRLRAGECFAGLDSLLTLSPTSRANLLLTATPMGTSNTPPAFLSIPTGNQGFSGVSLAGSITFRI